MSQIHWFIKISRPPHSWNLVTAPQTQLNRPGVWGVHPLASAWDGTTFEGCLRFGRLAIDWSTPSTFERYQLGMRTDGQNIHCILYRTSSLWGRCPKKKEEEEDGNIRIEIGEEMGKMKQSGNHEYNTYMKKKNRVLLNQTNRHEMKWKTFIVYINTYKGTVWIRHK